MANQRCDASGGDGFSLWCNEFLLGDGWNIPVDLTHTKERSYSSISWVTKPTLVPVAPVPTTFALPAPFCLFLLSRPHEDFCDDDDPLDVWHELQHQPSSGLCRLYVQVGNTHDSS